jgi:predicted transcriptional regulator
MGRTYTGGMEVSFTPEQESRLKEVAARAGKPVDVFVRDIVSLALEDEARFVEGIEKGFASLDRGEYLEHEEVGARLERLLRS